MRRSICTTEPSHVFAGDFGTWRFIYSPGTNLPKGATLLFDMGAGNRPIDWEIPTSDVNESANIIYAHLADKKIIEAAEVEDEETGLPRFEFTLPAAVKAGQEITIVVGTPRKKEKTKIENGNQAQLIAQRRRPFYLYIDPKGKSHYDEPEVFSLDVKGNILESIRIIAPSHVTKNKRFDVTVRFEDAHGNLTGSADDEEALIELSYENIRENLNWKLFIPETGHLLLPNLYFNEAGTYTIQLKNTQTDEVFRSGPIRCFNEEHPHLYWGHLHGESDRYNASDNIDDCLRHLRDECAYNFFATSPFESNEETPNETWRQILQSIHEFSEDDRFITLGGFQWAGSAKTEGLRTFIYSKEQKTLMRKKDAKYSSLKKIYKQANPKELISIPSFTMAKGNQFDFKNFDPDFERVVEIYNSWGSSETTKKKGNPCPIAPSKKKGISEADEGAIIEALDKGHRFGFVAGGLDDRGIFEGLYENEQTQYPPGLTAILSKDLTRDGLYNALWNRNCYATSGERIILGFSIAGTIMGQEVSLVEKPGLAINRHIVGHIAGTSPLHKIEIIRNGKVIETFSSESYHYDFTYDDFTPLEKHFHKPHKFVYYYVRVTQDDGHMAWSSPIWIDG